MTLGTHSSAVHMQTARIGARTATVYLRAKWLIQNSPIKPCEHKPFHRNVYYLYVPMSPKLLSLACRATSHPVRYRCFPSSPPQGAPKCARVQHCHNMSQRMPLSTSQEGLAWELGYSLGSPRWVALAPCFPVIVYSQHAEGSLS